MGAFRAGFNAAAFAALVLLGAWCLDRYARYEFNLHLRDHAAVALAQAATGATPHEWRFRTAEDLVAGHPFGSDQFEFKRSALLVHDQGKPVEIGLPLARSVDLAEFSRLQLDLDAESAGECFLIIREKLTTEEQISSPVKFASGRSSQILDLHNLAWTIVDSNVKASAPPRNTAMLRIRFALAKQTAISLHSASLRRSIDYAPLNLAVPPSIVEPGQPTTGATLNVYRLPFNANLQKVDIEAIVANRDSLTPPLILLPAHGRVEQQMAMRNAVYSALPAAILIPEAEYAGSFAQARQLVSADAITAAPGLPWGVVAAFAILFVAARAWPPGNPRVRALLEIALTLGAPAWLIVGGYFDGSLHLPHYTLITLTLLFAASLSLPRTWHWIGDARTWLFAALVVMLALAIGLILHRSGARSTPIPGLRQVARYFAWALLQQYLICAICTERWRVVTGNTYAAVYLGALGFALLHTPNAALMLATFAGGLFWCAIYLRDRALLPLALSHTACALSLVALLPPDILRSAEVSVRFFQ